MESFQDTKPSDKTEVENTSTPPQPASAEARETKPIDTKKVLIISAHTPKEHIQQHESIFMLSNATLSQLQLIDRPAHIILTKNTPIETIRAVKNCSIELYPGLSEQQVRAIPLPRLDIHIRLSSRSAYLFNYLHESHHVVLGDDADVAELNKITQLLYLMINTEEFPASKLHGIQHFQCIIFRDIEPNNLTNYLLNLPRQIEYVDIEHHHRAHYKALGTKKQIKGLYLSIAPPGLSFAHLPENITHLLIECNEPAVSPTLIRSIPAHVQKLSLATNEISEELMAAIPAHLIVELCNMKAYKKLPPHITKVDITTYIKSAKELSYLPKTVDTIIIDKDVSPQILAQLPTQIKKAIFKSLTHKQLSVLRESIQVEAIAPENLKHSVDSATREALDKRKQQQNTLKKAPPKVVKKKPETNIDEVKEKISVKTQEQIEHDKKIQGFKAQFQLHSAPVQDNQGGTQRDILEQLMAEFAANKAKLHAPSWPEKDLEVLHSEKKYKEGTTKLDAIEAFFNKSYEEIKQLQQEFVAASQRFDDEVARKTHDLEQALLTSYVELAEQCILEVVGYRAQLFALIEGINTHLLACKQKSNEVPELIKTLQNTISGTERKLKNQALEEAKEEQRAQKAKELTQEKLEKRKKEPKAVPASSANKANAEHKNSEKKSEATATPVQTAPKAPASKTVLSTNSFSYFNKKPEKEATQSNDSKQTLKPDIALAIAEHASHRVDLFLNVLIACYDTKKSTQEVHYYSTFPVLQETESNKIFQQFTTTFTDCNQLPTYVTQFDDLLKRKKNKYLNIVNQVAQGKKTVVEGLQEFIDILHSPNIRTEYKACIAKQEHHYIDEVIQLMQLGTRGALNADNKVDLNYVDSILLKERYNNAPDDLFYAMRNQQMVHDLLAEEDSTDELVEKEQRSFTLHRDVFFNENQARSAQADLPVDLNQSSIDFGVN